MSSDTEKQTTIVFLCVANAARSQMAEGLARASAPPGWSVFSAGSDPGIIHPLAIEALSEIGIDISDMRSKGLDAVPLGDANFVVTLCDKESCPVLPQGPEHLDWSLPDPVDQRDQLRFQMDTFRGVRDAIKQKLDDFWAEQAS